LARRLATVGALCHDDPIRKRHSDKYIYIVRRTPITCAQYFRIAPVFKDVPQAPYTVWWGIFGTAK
jgi:hypothetical protein